MSVFLKVRDRLIENKKRKLLGEDLSIPFVNFPKLSTVIPGVQKGRYIIVTGGPKSAKSQITSNLFITNTLDFLHQKPNTNIKVKIFVFSLEMSKEYQIEQIISNRIFLDTKKIISPENLNSYFNTPLDDDVAIDLHTEAYTKWFEFLEKHVTYIDNIRTPEGIYGYMFEYAKRNGKFFYKGKEVDTSVHNFMWDEYVENDKDLYTIVITDHVGLLESTSNHTDLRLSIEYFSKRVCIPLRDKFQFTIVNVQQQALGAEMQEFNKNGEVIVEKVKPKHTGLGDSKTTARDCDIIYSIFNPSLYEIPTYPVKNGYNITIMRNHYRELSILLNRRGQNGISLDLFFHGAISYFKELPPPEKMTAEVYRKLGLIK